MQLPEALERLLASLHVARDGTLVVDGRAHARTGAPAPASPQEKDALLWSRLSQCLYERAYTGAAPDLQPGAEPPVASTAIVETIVRANSTPARQEYGWSLQETAADGAVVATRHGRTRRFEAGQFMLLADHPGQPGAPLLVHWPQGSANAQAGFYYCFGKGFQDHADRSRPIRLYWNLRLDGLGAWVRTVTARLNRYEIPFQLKVTTRQADFRRADNAVLYLARRWLRVASMALETEMPHLARTLDPAVPMFTRRLAPGIGFAEDPGAPESFGSSRCKLAATALLAAWGDGPRDRPIPLETFRRHFRQTLEAAGLRPEALYLNPGSEDLDERDFNFDPNSRQGATA